MKSVLNAFSKEQLLNEGIHKMNQCPTRGKGINTETYSLRRKFLESPEHKEQYAIALPSIIETTQELIDHTRNEYVDSVRFTKAMTMGKCLDNPALAWRHYADLISVSSGAMPFDKFCLRYAAYEKEIDDYVRLQYGFNSLWEYLTPLIEALKEGRRELAEDSTLGDMPKELTEALALLSGVAERHSMPIELTEALEGQQKMEILSLSIATLGNRIFGEWVCVQAGIYEQVFGHTLAYVPPFNSAQFTAYKDACEAEKASLAKTL